MYSSVFIKVAMGNKNLLMLIVHHYFDCSSGIVIVNGAFELDVFVVHKNI